MKVKKFAARPKSISVVVDSRNDDRYKSLFDNAPIPLVVLSSDGVIVEGNQAIAKLAKTTQLPGRHLQSWISTGCLPKFEAFLVQCFAPGAVYPITCQVETAGLITSTGDGLGFFRLTASPTNTASECQISIDDITMDRSAAQLAGVGHWSWIFSTDVLTWSDEIYRITGLDPTQYQPSFEGLREFYTEESMAALTRAVQESVSNKVAYELNLTLRRRDGTGRCLTARGEPILAEDGNVVGLHGTVQDITVRKNLEAALLKRQQMWREAEIMGKIGGWDRSLPDGPMTISDGFAQIMGMNRTEITIAEALAVVHPEDRNKVCNAIVRAHAGEEFSHEYRILREDDGCERVINAQARIVRDEAGVPVRTFGKVQDVTERKLLEAALLSRQEIWQQAEEIGRLGGWNRNIATGIMTISDGYARILGTSQRTFAFQDFVAFFHADDLSVIQQAIQTGMTSTDTLSIEFRIVRADDHSERVVRAYSRFIHDTEGKPIRSFGAVQDVTERKQVELALAAAKDKADAALKAKGMFLAAMSHEIRTPLNSVIGLSNLLSESGLNAQQNDFLETIRSSGEMLLSIVNDILDFSKLDDGKVSLEHISFNLHQAASEVLQMVAESAHKKRLRLHFDFADEDDSNVRGDPGRLKQVLLNLLANAVKFTAAGSVTLRIERTGEEFRFLITDTGIGIPADSHSALFQLFSQADSSTTRRFGGTGLGLAISKRLVELLGGSIGLASEVGQGSTFWFTLKLPSATVDFSRLFMGRRALIADTDAAATGQLRMQLESLGIAVETTSSFDAAISLIAVAAPFSFVFIDPEVAGCGWKLATAIRAQPERQSIPLYIIANSRFKSNANYDGFLLKPISRRILTNALRRLPSALPQVQPLRLDAIHSKGRVLVVEDNRVNQKVASASLERLGYCVEIAQDGEEAILRFGNSVAEPAHHYDLILMDCHMPGIDGFEATESIRRLEAASNSLRRIPIVALTADVLDAGMDRCTLSGMDGFLSKPLRLADLASTLQRFIPSSAPVLIPFC